MYCRFCYCKFWPRLFTALRISKIKIGNKKIVGLITFLIWKTYLVYFIMKRLTRTNIKMKLSNDIRYKLDSRRKQEALLYFNKRWLFSILQRYKDYWEWVDNRMRFVMRYSKSWRIMMQKIFWIFFFFFLGPPKKPPPPTFRTFRKMAIWNW